MKHHRHSIGRVESCDLTKGVSGDDGRVLGWQAYSKLVLGEDPEDVLLKLDKADGLVARLLDGGGEAVPDLAVGCSPLHQVVGHSGAAVVTRRVPCQQARLVGDLRDVEGGRRAGLVCVINGSIIGLFIDHTLFCQTCCKLIWIHSVTAFKNHLKNEVQHEVHIRKNTLKHRKKQLLTYYYILHI